MAGALVGLDLNEALTTARLFGAVDEALCAELLSAIEIGALAGAAKQTPQSDREA